jgi:hypothetical protein
MPQFNVLPGTGWKDDYQEGAAEQDESLWSKLWHKFVGAGKAEGAIPSAVKVEPSQLGTPSTGDFEYSPTPPPLPMFKAPDSALPPTMELPPVPEVTKLSTSTSLSQRLPPAGMPGEYARWKQMMDELQNSGLQSLNKQQAGLSDMEKMLQSAIQMKPGMDLSPLMALADAMNDGKTNLAASYNRPSTDRHMSNIQSLQSALQKGRNDLGESEVNLAKSKLSNEQQLIATMQRDEDQAAQRQMMALAYADKKDAKNDLRVETDIKTLQARIGDGAPGLLDKMGRLNEIVSKYQSDLPGVGAGDKWKPDMMVGRDGQTLRQVADGILADTIKMYSGVAASEPEVKRLNSMVGRGWMNDDEQFREGMDFLRTAAMKRMAAIESAVLPEAAERYKSRGGINSKQFDQFSFHRDKVAAAAPSAGDQAAIDYARANPQDPYSQEILKANGLTR